MTSTPNPIKNSDAFREAARRVVSGQSTKEVEASILNIKPGTFAVWMTRAGITSRKNNTAKRRLHGAALGWVTADPIKAKALEEATARVLAGELTSTQASKEYPELSSARATLAARVRRAREKL